MQILKSIALAVLMLALTIGTQNVSAAPAQWDGGKIRVEGLGIAPADARGSQAEALARRAALSDAYRQLAEQINGVNVDAVNTVENMTLMNTTVRTHVTALIQGAQIIDESARRDGSYVVTMEIPVYGTGSLASTVFTRIETRAPWAAPESVYAPYTPVPYDTTGYGTYERTQNQTSSSPILQAAMAAGSTAAVTVPSAQTTPAITTTPTRPAHPAAVVTTPTAPTTPPAVVTPTAPTTPPAAVAVTPAAPLTPAAPTATTPPAEIVPKGQAVGGYTGVIIDCTGLGLRPAMSPVIKAENGQPIYGYKNLDVDKVVASGMASYAHSDAEATRAGANPLHLRAVSVDHNANPVLSAGDANRLLLENSASGFLDATNVVFLR
ncbi:LPP20 family lipoprotein [uncultured Selenomonas sp.]|uniref:LPP20 family lipoprotein n=1 Tax=uncultured Selenomonas sp. TaxID=159275 RepID=UPI0028EA3D98|nr:LPP20 family lipoprotein [uncultured Selenomonas sp.]